MVKYYDDLTFIQKLKIKWWFKRHAIHYSALKERNICDVVSLDTGELLISFYISYEAVERQCDIFARHKTDFIMFRNVIFRL